MANVDSPYGLRPVGHLAGNASFNTIRCRITDTAGDLGVGDAVVWNGAGSGAYFEIVGATVGATNSITGVIQSFEPNPATGLETLYIASADSGWANVIVDPHVIYSIQANGVVGNADYGQNAVLVADHTVNTSTGISGTEMNATTGSDNTYQLTIIGGVDRDDNDLTLTHAEYLVIINLHSFYQGAVTAGV
jgi:hypothetical protein